MEAFEFLRNLKNLRKINLIVDLTQLPRPTLDLRKFIPLIPTDLPITEFTIQTHWQDFESDIENDSRDQLSYAIAVLSKLNSLKVFRLEFGIYGFKKTDIFVDEIFRNFVNLRELHLNNCTLKMEREDLVEYIRAVEKLRLFDFSYSEVDGIERKNWRQ